MPATAGRLNAIMKNGRTARRLLADERSAEKARERSAKLRAAKEARGEREYNQQVRRILRELGLRPDAKAWGRIFHVKSDKTPERAKRKTERTVNPTELRLGVLNYKAPIRDDRGRIAVFVRMRYLGQKSKGYRSGLAADHVKYIFREDGLEDPEIQLAEPMSNVGETVEECAAFWSALEPIEEGFRANSKIQFRMTVALPYFFDAEQRRRVTQAIGDQVFGRVGLGWMAANHLPDAKGSQRNFHLHFAASMRPAERIGDHEWAFTEEKLTEPFTPEGLLRMRATIAAIINLECRRAGLEERYTHQSYQRRGINAISTEHVGPERMALHDKGEPVGVVERNNARIEENELSVEAQYLSKRSAIQERLVELAKEAVMRARRSVNVRSTKDAVARLRNMAAREAVLQSDRPVRRVRLDTGDHLRTAQDTAKKLQSAKSSRIQLEDAQGVLDRVNTMASDALQTGARKPRRVNQAAKGQTLALMAKLLRVHRSVQPNGIPAPRSDAIELVAKRADELRQLRQGAPALTVRLGAILELQSVFRLAGSSRSGRTEPRSLNAEMHGHLASVRKRTTAIMKSEQPKKINTGASFDIAKVVETANAIRKQSSINKIPLAGIASVADIASIAATISNQLQQRKVTQEGTGGVAVIKRRTNAMRTAPDRPHRAYTEELELLQNIRAAILKRTAPSSVGSPAANPQEDRSETNAPQNPRGVISAPWLKSQRIISAEGFGGTQDDPAVASKVGDPDGSQKRTVEDVPEQKSMKSPVSRDASDNSRPTPRLNVAPVSSDPQRIVDLLAGERFAVEEAHRSMFVPLTPVLAKHGMDDGALLHPLVQTALAQRLELQREDERLMVPLLARYVREEDMNNDKKIVARVADEGDRQRVEQWRGTGLLHLLMTRIRDDQKRETEKLYRKWCAARAENRSDRVRQGGLAYEQQQRWPIDLPDDDRTAIGRDAAVYRQRQKQMHIRAQGMGY